MEYINTVLESGNYAFIGFVILGVIVLWFLPAMLALVFNRKHFKYIVLACIPAGFSVIAWVGVLIWATTGKVFSKHAHQIKNEA